MRFDTFERYYQQMQSYMDSWLYLFTFRQK